MILWTKNKMLIKLITVNDLYQTSNIKQNICIRYVIVCIIIYLKLHICRICNLAMHLLLNLSNTKFKMPVCMLITPAEKKTTIKTKFVRIPFVWQKHRVRFILAVWHYLNIKMIMLFKKHHWKSFWLDCEKSSPIIYQNAF